MNWLMKSFFEQLDANETRLVVEIFVTDYEGPSLRLSGIKMRIIN